jgi:hypothetical protein
MAWLPEESYGFPASVRAPEVHLDRLRPCRVIAVVSPNRRNDEVGG